MESSLCCSQTWKRSKARRTILVQGCQGKIDTNINLFNRLYSFDISYSVQIIFKPMI